jgi:hypothetical protein
MKKVCVVVPIYKPVLNEYEKVSLAQMKKVLHKHPVKIVAPNSLRLSSKELELEKFSIERFEDSFFSGIQGYNRLMLSSEFYQRFLEYKYILIYQLDAFVFRDELEYWCNQNYDYIGAPWICFSWYEQKDTMTRFHRVLKKIGITNKSIVGNGGFSLRKVSRFYLYAKIFRKIAVSWPYNEDMFWGLGMTFLGNFFKVPELKTALKFSFEGCPSKAYEENNYNLPFGCHAWEKYDISFWRPFFKSEGYII